MPTFLVTNRSPANYTGSGEAMAAWNAWFEQLGAHLMDRGNPVFERTTLGDCGPATQLGGYTLIAADDLESAVALARSCPLLAEGGGVEVGRLTELNSGLRANDVEQVVRTFATPSSPAEKRQSSSEAEGGFSSGNH